MNRPDPNLNDIQVCKFDLFRSYKKTRNNLFHEIASKIMLKIKCKVKIELFKTQMMGVAKIKANIS